MIDRRNPASQYTGLAGQDRAGEQNLCRHPCETSPAQIAQSYSLPWLTCFNLLSQHRHTLALLEWLNSHFPHTLSPPSMHALTLGPLPSLHIRSWIFLDLLLLTSQSELYFFGRSLVHVHIHIHGENREYILTVLF